MHNLFRNKKAMETALLVTIIVGLLVFMTTIGAYASTQKKVTNLKPYLTECKLTLGADVLTQDIRWLRSKIEDACYTVKLDNLNDFRRPSDILKYSSNRMAQAWDITWQGKKDLFDKNEGALAQGSGYDCIIFFDLDYTHPKYSGTIKKDDLMKFLIDQNYGETGQTYAQYLQGEKMNGAFFVNDDIISGNHYAVSIMNPHKAESSLFTWTGTILGGPIGLAMGWGVDSAIENIWDASSLNTVIVFSELSWAQNQGCVYRGVEV